MVRKAGKKQQQSGLVVYLKENVRNGEKKY